MSDDYYAQKKGKTRKVCRKIRDQISELFGNDNATFSRVNRLQLRVRGFASISNSLSDFNY